MIFRTNLNTPEVYSNESRDFQLFGKSLDLITNLINADATAIKYIADTDKIRNILLPLLQTKVGFFSKLNLDYDTLRNLLAVFLTLVKGKGSKKALQQCINAYFKVFNINSTVAVMYFDEDAEAFGKVIGKNTVVLGVDNVVSNIEALEEFFKYIVPAGVKTKVLTFSEFSEIENCASNDAIELLFVSTDINSALRGSSNVKPSTWEAGQQYDTFEDKVVAAVDTLEIIGSPDTQKNILEHGTIISNQEGE